jgi:hypothetical protein
MKNYELPTHYIIIIIYVRIHLSRLIIIYYTQYPYKYNYCVKDINKKGF